MTSLQDVRQAFRLMRRDAAFTAFAILIVGLGVGASATVFSVVNAVLVRPLPFHEPARLVWIINRDVSGLSGQTTQVDYLLDLRAHAQSYSDIAGYMAFYGLGDNVLTGQGEPERLSGVQVSDNFFQTLGVEPQIGRLFNPDECKWHGPRATLLSHGLWQRRFAADPSIVGRTLIINSEPVTVIGVMPESFDFAEVFAPGAHIDLYSPFPLTSETNRWGNTMAIVGRLKPGASLSAAQAELKILAPQLVETHRSQRDNTFEGHVSPLADHVAGRFRLSLIVLACAVGAVLLIVCANLSNLLLARGVTRQKELAIRAALGASRGRLLRQLLAEGAALAFCGAALGVLLAVGATHLLTRLDAVSIPMLRDVRTDSAALAFALLASLVTSAVFGLVPALQLPASALHDTLKDASRGGTIGRGSAWLRGALVTSEIALACVLLVGAGLLMRSFLRVLDVNMGFQPERAAAIRVDTGNRFSKQEQWNAFFDDVLRRARQTPGVDSAGLTDALPLGRNRSWGAGVKGHVYPPGQFPSAFPRVISDGYFAAMGIPLVAGRDFDSRDVPASDPVIILNQTMARALFPGESALGGIIRACGERRVVGVVGDVRHLALEQAAGLEMYLPIRQCNDFASVDLVVRTRRDPATLAGAIRGSLKPIAPNVPGQDFRVLQTLVDRSVSPRRFVVLLLGGFALFALVLASLGIYSVVSYSVNRRTQEIGIRMALGASAARLQARIVGQTVALAALGVLAGGVISFLLGRTLETLLFGVKSSDPATFCAVLVVLAGVAAAAGYIPARRASRIDPSSALRSE